ncbi:MAG TPA: DUF4189 domain-containing protein [Xanthobacteraceae bacterium]
MHNVSARRRPAAGAIIAAIALLCGVPTWPNPGLADGALAVGLPADVAQEGFAFGIALNKSSAEAASAQALADCRTETPGVDKRAQALCAVVGSFRDKCFAVAMDPQDATPGVGWAIATDKQAASSEALAKCVATAGESRRDACTVTHSDCDVSAK